MARYTLKQRGRHQEALCSDDVEMSILLVGQMRVVSGASAADPTEDQRLEVAVML